jgi:phage baseplate assembly protein W
MSNFLGIDLAVVPNFVAHDAAEVDLSTRVRAIRGPLPLGATQAVDLTTLDDRQNLAQALILRLLTPRGSLKALGHGEYGSRLHELIGQPKNPATRNLCRAFILEVVAQEPRVENKAVEISFDPLQEQVDSFVFTLAVLAIRDGDPLSVTLEVGL